MSKVFGLTLAKFQLEMAKKLSKNSGKRTWRDMSISSMLTRLKWETKELEQAINAEKSENEVKGEAADVANFAMFIADTYKQEEL